MKKTTLLKIFGALYRTLMLGAVAMAADHPVGIIPTEEGVKAGIKEPGYSPYVARNYPTYARVIEISIPHRAAYDAKRFGVKMNPKVPMTTQEQAYTSPI